MTTTSQALLIALAVFVGAAALTSPLWCAIAVCGVVALWTGWFTAHG